MGMRLNMLMLLSLAHEVPGQGDFLLEGVAVYCVHRGSLNAP